MGRVFGFLGTVVTLAIGMYIYSVQVKSVQPSADAASAERGYLASQGQYASLNDLVSGHYVTVNAERPPYFYDVETSANGFRATATRSSQGAPAQLWITETMQIQSSN
jgi:hypothetical protein